MAATTISVEQDQFCCSVCLEVLRDPVTIPCGHSYCLDCIEDYWNRAKKKGQYSCPQCRQAFNPRPLLSRNTVLGEVVQLLQRPELQAAAQQQQQQQQQQQPARPEEAKCGVCAGRKSKAVKSCPECSESYCAAHLRVHEERCQGRARRPDPATGRPDPATGRPDPATGRPDPATGRLCPWHDKPLRLHCRTDRKPVCSRCVREAHRGHDAVPLLEEREAQQKKLQEASLKCLQKLKDTEKELRYVVRYIKHSTEAAVEESDRVFSKLIRFIEKQSCEVKEVIRVQERAAVGRAEELLEKVQRDALEIRRTEAELESLSHTDDHVHFLQKCKSFDFPTKTVEMPSTDTLPYLMYKTIRGALADLKDGLGETLDREFSRISDKAISLKETNSQSTSEKIKAKDNGIPYNSEPKTRADFLQYYTDLTLDVNTANPFLSFCDGRRGVTTRSEPQPYPDHPSRFTSWAQVLCRAGMAGRCYWEVEWAGSGGVSIGACYKNMCRNGEGSDCKLGHNSKSWSLDCSHAAHSFQHNKESVAIAAPSSSRVGVYLDFRAGTLSFYDVSDSMVLLHKVKTTFTQPLYPGFWVGLGSTLKLCSL